MESPIEARSVLIFDLDLLEYGVVFWKEEPWILININLSVSFLCIYTHCHFRSSIIYQN